MKKLLLGILLLLCLSSCEEGFRTQKIDENSSVPITYSDSTRWKPAKVYVLNDDKMYVKIEKDVYAVGYTDKTARLLLIIMIFIIFVGLIIITTKS